MIINYRRPSPLVDFLQIQVQQTFLTHGKSWGRIACQGYIPVRGLKLSWVLLMMVGC